MSAALQTGYQKSTEVRNHAVDFLGSLEDNEKLVGTPTVTATPAGLTISNQQVTTVLRKINSRRVAAGRAAAFKVVVSGAPGTYTIIVRCGTDSDPAQTVEGTLTLVVT